MVESVSEELICGLCKGVAKESVQTIHCGAVFCKSCMEQTFAKVSKRRKKMSNPSFSPTIDHIVKIECPKVGCTEQ